MVSGDFIADWDLLWGVICLLGESTLRSMISSRIDWGTGRIVVVSQSSWDQVDTAWSQMLSTAVTDRAVCTLSSVSRRRLSVAGDSKLIS